MPALTKAQMRTRLHRKLGNRSDLATNIDDALGDAQDQLEADPHLMPWWMEKDTEVLAANISTVANTKTVAVPTGFLMETEDGGFFREDSSADSGYVKLVKDDFDALLASGTYSGTGKPKRYALKDDTLYLFPTPDAVYTLRGVFFKADDVLSGDSDTNGWSTHASRLLMSLAGLEVAEELGYSRHKEEFTNRYNKSYSDLKKQIVQRRLAAATDSAGD